jgi:hypothetical protein
MSGREEGDGPDVTRSRMRCIRTGAVAFAVRFELSSSHSVVIGMCTNPEPEDAIFNLRSQRPVVKTNPHGPKYINPLEVQRRVVGVGL